jgi:uncharacterized protein (TIGR02266 family)
MVDSRKRASASLKVKYKSTTQSQFISQFGLDISHAGMFIKTKAPLEPGALIRLELQLSDGVPVIVGSGRVRWRRVAATQSQAPAGMGIEFTRLDPESRRFVDSIVDGREGRPSRFEQTEGAEQAAASTQISSAPPSSSPPISGRVPARSISPEPDTPPPPPPTAPPPAPLAASSPPPPHPRAARTSLPPGTAGLFAAGTPGRAPSTDPFGETPSQGSFFGDGRGARTAPSQPAQSAIRTGGARESSARPMPSSRPDAADKLVDQLFADAIPNSPDSEPATIDLPDDPITSEFRSPIATGAPPAPSPDDGLRDPPPPLPKPASLPSPDLVLKAPSQFPAPLSSGGSGLPKPAKSTALIVSVVVVLGLCTAAVFYLL